MARNSFVPRTAPELSRFWWPMVDLMGLVACHFAWKCKRYLRAGVGLWLVGFLVGVGRVQV